MIALIFILTIPSMPSSAVRFQMSSFRIAIIFFGVIVDPFSLISFLHIDSRSFISSFISVVWDSIGIGFAGSVAPDFPTEIMSE